MGLFSLTPTFTQGLVLGQLSILGLLVLVLRYLLLDQSPLPSPTSPALSSSKIAPEVTEKDRLRTQVRGALNATPVEAFMRAMAPSPSNTISKESMEWFNFLLSNIVQAYRADMRGGSPGPVGDEAARIRVEKWARDKLASTFLAPVQIHSVNLGTSAPKLLNARTVNVPGSDVSLIEMDVTYTDAVSLSLSTSFLFNYPTLAFARLPISMSLSLSLFSAVITLKPPTPAHPSLSISLHPNFTLSLTQTSLLGSRGKLADVPKFHQMIEERIRGALSAKAGAENVLYSVLLPGLGRHFEGGLGLGEGMGKKEVDVIVEHLK